MTHHQYRCEGTCSSLIDYDLAEDGTVHHVRFTGGCNGNLQGIARLVEGRRAVEVAKLLSGVRCGSKPTSCPDQLARALSGMAGGH